MSTQASSLQEQELLGGLMANNQLAFSKLYDRYAATLLGVITKIVSDKTEAITVLETTFIRIRLQIDQFRPGKQPLFLWLLQIARATAVEALNERQQQKRSATTILQLTETGKVISPAWSPNASGLSGTSRVDSVDQKLNNLLDSILFKNCTAEEAATSLGLPVETIRQQLRVAMQQLRKAPKV